MKEKMNSVYIDAEREKKIAFHFSLAKRFNCEFLGIFVVFTRHLD